MNYRTICAGIVGTLILGSVVATCCQNRNIKAAKQATQDSIAAQKHSLQQSVKTVPFEIADSALANAKKVAIKRI